MFSKKVLCSFSVLSLALALCAWPAHAEETSNFELGPVLNTNGGFEDGKKTYHYTKPTLSFIDNDEVYRGQASLRLQGEGKTENGEANIAVQGFKIPPPGQNTRYLMRMEVKAKNVDPKFPPSVQIRREDANKKVSVVEAERLTIREDTDWKTLEIVCGPLPGDIAKLNFWIFQPAQSKAQLWIDNIEFRQILNSPPATVPAAAGTAASAFHAAGDGGAALSSAPAPSATVPAGDVLQRFPVFQSSRLKVMGGGVRGFGMLARYPQGGLRQVYVRRITNVPTSEPYRPVAHARVFDPTGNQIAFFEFTDQATGAQSQVLELPAGPAGNYRVSFSGGRANDLLEIGLPKTDVWGVRGEMMLGVSTTTPKTSYLYLPKTVKVVVMEKFGDANAPVEFFDETGKSLGEPKLNPANRRQTLVIDPAPAGTVCSVKLPATGDVGIAFDGVPGLLCPTAEAARQLQGGTETVDSFVMAGPLQARARRWMASQRDAKLDPSLTFPTEVPADLKSPRLEALPYGKYGNLNMLQAALKHQVVDANNPYYGANLPDSKLGDTPRLSWETFLYGSALSPFDATGLAGVVTTPGQMNPAYGNAALLRRAQLSALYHLVSMQGDDLLREGDFRTGNYPLTHAFFVYDGALARPYLLLKDKLDPQVAAIWRDGLMAVGDKMADYQAYQSNQWSHVISGHLNVYAATKEKRFLGYFERLMTAYLDNSFGPNSKYGLHPAGYYLEEFGPDGNYDSLNSYSIVSAYYAYRDLPEAKPELVQKLQQAIEKNLLFKSFYWLPQPDGNIFSPTAMNHRTAGQLGNPSYPGDYMAAPEFALAAKRFQMIPDPGKGAGDAGTFSHLANNDAWARRVLEWGIARKDTSFPEVVNFGGAWLPELHRAFTLPQKVQPAPLPVDAESGQWNLPGQVAWKRGALYGLVFYDVIGATSVLKGKVGGGPSVLWNRGTGSVVTAMRNAKGGIVSEPADLTHSCLFGEDDAGKFFWTGTERSEGKWIEDGKVFEIRSKLQQPAGELIWRYEISSARTRMTVQLTTLKPMKSVMLNLPILTSTKNVITDLTGNTFRFTLGGSETTLQWPTGLASRLEASGLPNIQRLVVAVPTDGTPLSVDITAR